MAEDITMASRQLKIQKYFDGNLKPPESILKTGRLGS
jgi:hypothetical protein